jgi:hypothetical protein
MRIHAHHPKAFRRVHTPMSRHGGPWCAMYLLFYGFLMSVYASLLVTVSVLVRLLGVVAGLLGFTALVCPLPYSWH